MTSPALTDEQFSLVRSIIYDCPALKMPQTFLQRLGATAQIVPLKGLTQEQAQAIVDRLNAASPTAPPDTLKQALEALEWTIRKIDGDACQHEDTYRGGAIWTICRDCGAKWADDRGGFKPYVEPPELTAARDVLASLQASLAAPPDTTGRVEVGAVPLIQQDEQYRRAVAIVMESGRASVSMVQRKLSIRYIEAQDLIVRMLRDGLVGIEDTPGVPANVAWAALRRIRVTLAADGVRVPDGSQP